MSWRLKKNLLKVWTNLVKLWDIFEDLLRSPRSINDTSGLGYDWKGESSRNGEKKNSKGKPTCHHYGKIGHTTKICRRKNGNHSPKKNTKGQYMKCKKIGH